MCHEHDVTQNMLHTYRKARGYRNRLNALRSSDEMARHEGQTHSLC